MADINEPEILNWLNGEMRPLAQIAQELRQLVNNGLDRYDYTNIKTLLQAHANADKVVDVARPELPELDKKDIDDIIADFRSILAEFDKAGKKGLRAKFWERLRGGL